MTTVNAKAFRVTETSREILQCFIVEQIPEDTQYVLASSEGYLFFNEPVGLTDELGAFRIPHLAMLSYYDIQYENE